MEETRVTRSVDLDAPADDVWRALTEPALLGEWLDSVVELDVRPGGDGVIVESDGAVRRARIEEVDPARRLALRWWPEDGNGPASRVELDLEATPEGTRVVVTETLVPSGHPSGSSASGYSASASAAAVGFRWGVRLLLLGCCTLRSAFAAAPVACG